MYDAVYGRQSIYKEGSISIETQLEMSEKACKNQIRYYKDAGFSGGTTNRPEFIRMMKDVESGIIERVVVYRLDRISRSLLDFAATWAQLERCGVEFISVTENFDTSTPMGQAMLYIAAVFAELERKDIIARVTDNYFARAKSGNWQGGISPYGFDLVKNPETGKGMLEPNEKIEIVKRIFEEYSAPLVSLSDLAKRFNEESIPGPRGFWNSVTMSRILYNPCYVKADVSIYSHYKTRGVEIYSAIDQFISSNACQLLGKTKTGRTGQRIVGTTCNKKTIGGMKLVISTWKGVIEAETFIKCQNKLEENRQIGKNGAGTHTWLSGLVKCGECHFALVVVHNEQRHGMDADYKYFRCSKRSLEHACQAKGFPKVTDLEHEVQRQLETVLNECQTVSEKPKENPELGIAIYKIEEQIQNLVNVLKSSVASEQMIQIVNKELASLGEQQKKLLEEQQKERVLVILERIDFSGLSFDDKKKVAHTYIKRIEVLPKTNEIRIEWKI